MCNATIVQVTHAEANAGEVTSVTPEYFNLARASKGAPARSSRAKAARRRSGSPPCRMPARLRISNLGAAHSEKVARLFLAVACIGYYGLNRFAVRIKSTFRS